MSRLMIISSPNDSCSSYLTSLKTWLHVCFLKLLLVLAILLLFVYVPRLTIAQDTPFSAEQRETIAHSVVQIQVVIKNGGSTGSGTIVSADGLIFTNAHVILGSNYEYHVQDVDQIRIGLFAGFRSTPSRHYGARIRYISDDPNFDFAVLQIDKDDNGRAVTTSALNLPFIPAWNKNAEIMDEVYFFSYQQAGNNFLVITSGRITSTGSRPINRKSYEIYQSDAKFSEGGSGGLAVNRYGEFIGIPWLYESMGGGDYLASILPVSTICSVKPNECAIEPTPPPEPILIQILANQERNYTGISIKAGQTFSIEYVRGSWRAGPLPTWPLVGPEGDPQVGSKTTFPVRTARIMSLVGGIGDQAPFLVGENYTSISQTSGELWLGANDDGFSDNAGILTLQITVQGSSNNTSSSCPGLPLPIVIIGQRARVTQGTSNRVRSAASIGAQQITQISPGTEFTIVDGPVCADSYRWWKINLSNGTVGWTADGNEQERWIEPAS